MATELHLKGAELITFAVVHQFSQSGAGIYKGNVEYLCAWFGWAENTARKHLASLVEKGLIKEIRGRENNSPFCHHELAPDFYEKHPAIIEVSPRKKSKKHPSKNEDSTPQNLKGDNNIGIIKRDNKFIPPTPQEVADYAKERGFRDPEGFANHFVEYYSTGENPWTLSNNKPMKDWKRSVITWEPNNKERIFDNKTAYKGTSVNAEQFRQFLR